MAPRAVQIVISATACTMLLAGCGAGARASAELDTLRRRVMELEKQTAELEGRNTELSQALDDSQATVEASPEVIEATPRLARLEIGRLTHADDSDGNGHPDVIAVYVAPSDGLGRFIQLVGTLSVTAAVVPSQGDSKTIGRVSLDPGELRGAYRSTILGTHYAMTVPIDLAGLDLPDCTVRVEFVDGYTGRMHSTYGEIDLEISP